jgi:cytochrome c553
MMRICIVCLVIAVLSMTVLACNTGGESRSPGEDIVLTRCGSCHSLDKVHKAQKTRDNWQSTIKRMRKYGAQLTDDEVSTLADYLTTEQK